MSDRCGSCGFTPNPDGTCACPPIQCPDGCVCEEKCLPAALELLEKAEASGATEILDLMGALGAALKEKSA